MSTAYSELNRDATNHGNTANRVLFIPLLEYPGGMPGTDAFLKRVAFTATAWLSSRGFPFCAVHEDGHWVCVPLQDAEAVQRALGEYAAVANQTTSGSIRLLGFPS